MTFQDRLLSTKNSTNTKTIHMQANKFITLFTYIQRILFHQLCFNDA